MAKAKEAPVVESHRTQPPAQTPEAREQQLIAMAYQNAEERLRNRTATAAEIIHFLKLASTKEQLEKEKLIEENKLLKAKTKNMESMANQEALYKEALDAMRLYSGNGGDVDDI